MPRKKQSPAPPTGAPQPAAARNKPAQSITPAATSAAGRKTQPAAAPRTHRELAEAIFAQCDPVAIGRELLECGGGERGGSVKARVWERLVEFLLGKPAQPPKEETLEIIWDLPGPPRDPDES